MAEGELTPEEVAQLRQVLVELESTLEKSLEETAEAAKPVELEELIGRVSRMDALQQQEMASANRRSIRLRLDLVRAALQRIDRGEYGTCVQCEEPIDHRRLQARPESRLCLECKSAREQR